MVVELVFFSRVALYGFAQKSGVFIAHFENGVWQRQYIFNASLFLRALKRIAPVTGEYCS